LNKETNKGRSDSDKILEEYYNMTDRSLADSPEICTDFSPRIALFGVICMVALIGTFFL